MIATSKSFKNLTILCSLLVSIALTTITVQSASLPSITKKRASTCNGSSDLCNRLYSNVTFAGAHNSYAIVHSGTSLASNQNTSIANQLDAGMFLLQSQAHKSTNSTPTGVGIDLCHTSCSLFQGGSLENWLSQVKNWTDENPNNVITLLIVNSDNLPASTFGQAFSSTGLSDKMYQPSMASMTKQQWPTLGSMIDSGKTVVGFLASEADTSSVPYLLDEFSNIWETPYDQTSTPFNCSVDRIGSNVESESSSIMYLSNQFLDISILGDSNLTTPDVSKIGSTNSIQSTLQNSDNCASLHSAYPNFILTDYSTTPNYNFPRAVAQLNGVSYTAPSGSSSSGSGSLGSSNAAIGGHISKSTITFTFIAFVSGWVCSIL